MTRLFNIFGEIKSVYIHKTPCSQLPEKENYKYFKQFDEIKGFKVAYIVFNKKCIPKILECDEVLFLPENSLSFGIQSKFTYYL